MVEKLIDQCEDHLKNNNMTYVEHFKFASLHGYLCIKAGFFLCVHSIFPCFFQKAGSRLVHKLEQVFIERENEINELKPDTSA